MVLDTQTDRYHLLSLGGLAWFTDAPLLYHAENRMRRAQDLGPSRMAIGTLVCYGLSTLFMGAGLLSGFSRAQQSLSGPIACAAVSSLFGIITRIHRARALDHRRASADEEGG